jgi:hypothetical protein
MENMVKLDLNQMSEVQGGSLGSHIGCGGSMGAVSIMWSCAFGLISAGAGAIAGVAMLGLSLYVCYNA